MPDNNPPQVSLGNELLGAFQDCLRCPIRDIRICEVEYADAVSEPISDLFSQTLHIPLGLDHDFVRDWGFENESSVHRPNR